MVTLRAIARDVVDLGKDTLAEAFEREWMHAPQHFPIRFLNLLHSVPVHWGSASVTREAAACVGPRDGRISGPSASTPPIISASLCCPRHDALRSIFWMLRRPFFTGLACMLSSGLGKRRIGTTTFFAAQSIRRFSLAWPYFRMSVAQRRMFLVVRYACYISAKLALHICFPSWGMERQFFRCARNGAQPKRPPLL